MKTYENYENYKLLDKNNIPGHLAIIMDGNGRWAKSKNQMRAYGHYHGVKRVVEIVETSSNIGVKTLSLYAFSNENWKRPIDEVNKLMFLIVKFIDDYIEELARNNVKLYAIGDLSELPKNVQEKLDYAMNMTEKNTGMRLNICLNYGGRQEILLACKKLIKDYANKSDLEIDAIDLPKFEEYLYTDFDSDIDLLIRTSGEQRLSNFLLYQMAYAELYFDETYWPDFDSDKLFKAILAYQNRDRRFGGLK